jgi:hypothetical protein
MAAGHALHLKLVLHLDFSVVRWSKNRSVKLAMMERSSAKNRVRGLA